MVLKALACAALAVSCMPALADNFLYGNNATFGTPYVFKIDKTTGAILDTYTNLSGNNGRGSVVVGNTLYYTAVSSGNVYSYNLATHTNNGVAFSVSGTNSLSTIAYDGTNFIIGDYSGSNKVFTYSTTGSLLSTVALSGCTGYCDGLEYFQKDGQGFLLSNRGDAMSPYDVYSLSGTLVTAGFITPKNTRSTGIAFDGTDFFTSQIDLGLLDEYDLNGTFIKTLTLTGAPNGYSPLIEDLSADYSQVLPPPPPPPPSSVPEPNTLILLATGALGAVSTLRRRLFN